MMPAHFLVDRLHVWMSDLQVYRELCGRFRPVHRLASLCRAMHGE
jgi:hypothetical protein